MEEEDYDDSQQEMFSKLGITREDMLKLEYEERGIARDSDKYEQDLNALVDHLLEEDNPQSRAFMHINHGYRSRDKVFPAVDIQRRYGITKHAGNVLQRMMEASRRWKHRTHEVMIVAPSNLEDNYFVDRYPVPERIFDKLLSKFKRKRWNHAVRTDIGNQHTVLILAHLAIEIPRSILEDVLNVYPVTPYEDDKYDAIYMDPKRTKQWESHLQLGNAHGDIREASPWKRRLKRNREALGLPWRREE